MLSSYHGSTILSSLQPIMPCFKMPFARVSGWTLNWNGIWSFLRPCFKDVGSLSEGLTMARLYTSEVFQVGLLYYLVLNSGWSVSINVNKTRKHFPETFHDGARMFHNVSQFSHMGNIVSSAIFCFQDATKIRACEKLQKFCEHEQASTHLIFASNSSRG